MPLSAWPAKRCGWTGKEEDVHPRIPPHTDYSSKERGRWGGGVGRGVGRRTQQNKNSETSEACTEFLEEETQNREENAKYG